MKTLVLKSTLLAALLLVPPPALLRASGAPEPPEAPAPPAPPEAPHRRTKKIIVDSPEKKIVVDGDRVFIGGDGDDRDLLADLDGLEAWSDADGRAMVMRLPGPAGGGFIGVRPIEMTPELRQHFGAPKDAGILVGSVEPDGPAAKAGLQVGDIVTKVDGDRIASAGELVRTVRHRKGGETITVEVFRNRAAKSLTVTVVERKEKEIRVGELRDRKSERGWNWKTPSPAWPMAAPRPEDGPELQQRLDELEKKVRELEGRLPSR